MTIANLSEFIANIDTWLDRVENVNEILLLKRKTGNGVVVMSVDEYNSLMETVHLLKSPKNRARLQDAIIDVRSGSVVDKN